MTAKYGKAERSRRIVFMNHKHKGTLAECPVCRQALEADHEEAIAIGVKRWQEEIKQSQW